MLISEMDKHELPKLVTNLPDEDAYMVMRLILTEQDKVEKAFQRGTQDGD